MSKTDTSADGRELLLNLSQWIERRKGSVGPYADHIIHTVDRYEEEIKRLRAQLAEAEAALEAEKITSAQAFSSGWDAAFNEGIEAAAQVAADRYKAWGTDQALSVVECDYSACHETSEAIRALAGEQGQ